MRKNWLRENITSVLALIWTLAGLGIIAAVMFGGIKVDKEVAFLIVGIISTSLSNVLGYYFGANKSSNERARMEAEAKSQEQTVKQTLETTVIPAPAEEK